MQRATSQPKSEPSMSQSLLAYATERAEVLFGCYRRGDANDPDRYVTSIAAVLSLYDAQLIRDVTDPRTGITTTKEHCTFMPSSGELKRYCDAVASRVERLKSMGPAIQPSRQITYQRPPVPIPQGALASVFVPEHHPRYGKLVEYTKTADEKWWRFDKSSDGRGGVWVPWDVWQGGGRRMPV